MPDREKVIREFEFIIRDFCPLCTSDEYNLEVMKAVLALLKEQQHQIWELNEINEYLDDVKKDQEHRIDELLKEQEDVSNALVDQCDRVRRLRKQLAEQPQIVRCKDCKHKYYELSDGRIVCTHIDKEGNDEHGADWFCADGEKADE